MYQDYLQYDLDTPLTDRSSQNSASNSSTLGE